MFAPLVSKTRTRASATPTRQETRSPANTPHGPNRASGSGPAWDFGKIRVLPPDRASSPGEPLDYATRRYFERRFAHDFGGVRVHTDQAAQASAAFEQAVAYTIGQDIMFAAGHYQPHTPFGGWVIAHELAHVIQQRGADPGPAASEAALEREANQAATHAALGGSAAVDAARGAPAVQFLKVSPGGFGKALEEYTNIWHVEDKAIRLLQKSTTFMQLAATLDLHYIWPHDPAFNFGSAGFEWEVGPDGRMVRPAKIAGKRPLFVVDGEPQFETFNAPTNPLSGDVISIKSDDTPVFIQGIAHEATHAARFVGSPAPQPQTLVAEIEAGIQDEIATRKSEAKILGEIPDPKVKARLPTVGTTVPREVERDIIPAQNLTYMELFFFGRELTDAQKAEGLTDDEASDIRNKIGDAPTSPPFIFGKHTVGGIFRLSEYAEAWFDRQTAVKEWKDFLKNNMPSDPSFAADKEKLLQDHATRFFKGKVSYRP